MNEFMKQAYDASMINAYDNFKTGGPFGAVIVKDDKIVAMASSTVLLSHDPTAHADINVIRKASAILHTHDLSDCTLYTSSYPCPMCLSAILLSGIKEVYYGNKIEEIDELGFKFTEMYDNIRSLKRRKNLDNLKFKQLDHEVTEKALKEFKKVNGTIY